MFMVFVDEAHAGNILQNLWLQCQKEAYCDLVFIVDAEAVRIPAHRSVLAAASRYFISLFVENSLREVKISWCANTFHALIKYIYTGRVEICEDNVMELLEIAYELLLHNVVTACGNFLAKKLNPKNCFEIMSLAEKFNCENLLQKSKCYIMEYFLEASETDEFYNLRFNELSDILASDDLGVSCEEDVFYCLMSWIQHDPTEREQYKADLLKLLRMPLLETSFLSNNVRQMCTSLESLTLYMEALEHQMLPDRKTISPRNNNSQFLMATTIDHQVKRMYIHYYCPQRLEWLKWSKFLEYRFSYGVAIHKYNLYIVGGERNFIHLNSVICLNLKSMTISELTPMIEKRSGCRAAILNGYLYAVGGIGLKSVEKWDPNTKTWTKVASMSVERFNFGIAVLNEKLYVVGGHRLLASAEYYDPRQNIWTSISTMKEGRGMPGIAVANGILYVLGSSDGSTTVESYDPETDKWILIRSLNEKLYGCQSCATFSDKVVVCYKDRIEEYNVETNEWISRASSNKIKDIHRLFTYSSKIRVSEFVDNN